MNKVPKKPQSLKKKIMEERMEEEKLVVTNDYLNSHDVFLLSGVVCKKKELVPKDSFRQGKFGDIISCASKKYVLKRFYLDDANHLMLRREIDIHTSINHQHIVPCYGVLQRPDREIGLVLQRCRTDLFEYIHSTDPLDCDEVQSILRQVIGAIQHLVRHRIVHRDIKPENILIEKHSNNVMLADFGWSKKFNENREPDNDWCITQAGTAEYCPPECVKGENMYRGFPVDRWALGILAYELANGDTYFSHDDRKEVTKEIKLFRGFNKPIADMPLINDFCSRLIKRKPEHRMTLEQAMGHPLIVPAPVLVTPPPPPLSLKRNGSSSCGIEMASADPRVTKRQRPAVFGLI